EYLRELTLVAPGILQDLITATSRDRDGLLQGEQIVQDFLCSAFSPFIGFCRFSSYISRGAGTGFAEACRYGEAAAHSAHPFALIGAHYRSSGSSRGRKSAFSTHRSSFLRMLENVLDLQMLKLAESGLQLSYFEELWHSVYLQQYFRLFDRRATLNEWAREQTAAPVAILTPDTEPPGDGQLSAVTECGGTVITLPADLLAALVSDEAIRTFAAAVTVGVIEALKVERPQLETLITFGSDYPTKVSLSSWNILLRAANSIASNLIEKGRVHHDLEPRLVYSRGLVLFNESMRSFRNELLGKFPPDQGPFSALPDSAQRTSAHLSRIVEVFQSLQLYTRWFGANCVAASYGDQNAQRNKTARGSEPASYPGELYRSSLTLFWEAGRPAPPALGHLLHGT
ncbi:MAG: hypothetical protein M3O15_00750, partial [Acidobacteriota bacterium]|nr:hypothetical protein [Acidobacteriota bacterium]